MNKEYIKLNDTDYIVANDNGNLNLIKSKNDINEILNTENEIEHSDNIIKTSKKDLKNVLSNERMRNLVNGFILGGGIFMTLVGISGPFGVMKVLVVEIYALSLVKAMTTFIYGIKFLNRKKIKNLTSSIENDSHKIETLTKKLEELKTNSNYQVLPYLKTNIKPMVQPNNEYEQKKILIKNK